MPKVSVVMSVYNEHLDWIQQAIDSILTQTFTDFELILINDNPGKKELRDFLEHSASADSRIKIITNAHNIGLTKSLNIGIAQAKAEYIVRMDADDISMPNRLQVQLDYMESHPEVDVCGSWVRQFGDITWYSPPKLKVPESHEQIAIQAVAYSPMVHPSVMIRMTRLSKPIYDEKFIKAQDYALWGKLIIQGCIFYNIPKYLIKYRITGKSANADYRSKQFHTSDIVRKNIMQNLYPEIGLTQTTLHNCICNEQPCDIKEAEKWLLELRQQLKNYNPNESEFISFLIARLWKNINIVNGISFRRYRKSQLTDKISIHDLLQFAKHGLF